MSTIQLVSLLTAILGAVLGSAGLAISILAFVRDRPKIRVHLQWDLDPVNKHGPPIGVVSVSNVGRRPIYIGAVALDVPHQKYNALVLMDSLSGRRLAEGDAPAKFTVTYNKLDKYKDEWNKVRAFAEDSTGKKYYSKYTDKRPRWAE